MLSFLLSPCSYTDACSLRDKFAPVWKRLNETLQNPSILDVCALYLTHTGLLHCIWQPAQQRLSPPRHSKHGFRHSSTARTCMRSVEVSGVYCKKLGTPLAAANLINYTEGGWSGSVQQVGPGPALGAGLWPRTEVPLGTSPVYCPAHR